MIKRILAAFGALAVIAALTIPAFAIGTASDRQEQKRREAEQLPYLAQQALVDKKYDDAIEMFTKAIDSRAFNKQPHTLGQLYYGRGSAYHAKDDCDSAIKDYVKATEYLEKGDIHYALAICYVKLNQEDAAMAALDKAVQIDPEAVNYRSARCKFLFNRKKFAEALPDCDKALAKLTTDKDLMVATAQSAEQVGNRGRAAEVYKQLLALDPGNTIATEGLKRVGG
jgi:tetratricopeptide (TPR) repeat protein